MRAAPLLTLAGLGLVASCGSSGSGSSGVSGSLGFADGGVGPICGANAIVGTVIPNIDGPGGCGVRRAVQVQSVSGVTLTPEPTITCDTARALNAWVAAAAKPQIAATGERLAGLEIAAHYTCRNVNNAREGELSQHAYGRAVDVSGFRLDDGRTLTVPADWDVLRRLHEAGCGPFGTTLGPGSDGLHEDHLHYDIDRHGGSPYCR